MSKQNRNLLSPKKIPLRKDDEPDLRFKVAREFVSLNGLSFKYITLQQKKKRLAKTLKQITIPTSLKRNQSNDQQADQDINNIIQEQQHSPESKMKSQQDSKSEAKSKREAKAKLKKIGKMITLVQDKKVEDSCKAVQQGLLILNDDGSINKDSPLCIKDKMIGITDDGKLDESQPIMRYVQDRNVMPRTSELRDNQEQRKMRNQIEKETGIKLDKDQQAAHIIDIELFLKVLSRKPGLRSSNEELKKDVRIQS
ncbi:MAG: hypothetical protein EZS28_038944, partial [Streblomastix strix]